MPIRPSNSADWLRPPEEQEGLKRYVETMRERAWLIVGTILVTTLIAIAYVVTATKTYEAESELLVTPITGSSTVLASLGLIGASADPTRDVETASRLVTNLTVAESVQKAMNSPTSPQGLLEKVSAVPVAGSNFIAVSATENSPEAAKKLADAFAKQAVAVRTASLHKQIDEQLPVLEAQIESTAKSGLGETSLAEQVAQLQLLKSGPTPDLRVQTLASLPTAPSSPRKALSIAAGIIAGLILGVVAAFAAQVLDPRLRREAQLRRLYQLPVLGRIPKEGGTGSRPLAPGTLSTVATEAYRTLRATLATANTGREGGQVILVTGSAASEGKTTTAANLASSLAVAGKRVILIESDLRRPALRNTLGSALEGHTDRGVVSVLVENMDLSRALIPVEPYGTNLRVLLADHEGGWIADLFSLPAAEQMIEEARALADHVIIDSPPLNEVVDALPLARMADTVLIVAKLGHTRLDKLARLGELLVENEVRPAGFALVSTPPPARGEYQYFTSPPTHLPAGERKRRLVGARRRS